MFRWAIKAEEQPAKTAGSKRSLAQGQGSGKRAKAEASLKSDDDYDGLTAGLDGFLGKKQGRRGMHDNAKTTRGVLKKVMPLPGTTMVARQLLSNATCPAASLQAVRLIRRVLGV